MSMSMSTAYQQGKASLFSTFCSSRTGADSHIKCNTMLKASILSLTVSSTRTKMLRNFAG